jgi:hypothetical protein
VLLTSSAPSPPTSSPWSTSESTLRQLMRPSNLKTSMPGKQWDRPIWPTTRPLSPISNTSPTWPQSTVTLTLKQT